ncbi:MAG: ABC transporter ATP-binding protein [Elusimicrobiota bacterium]|jgi:lipoprotein-releasing system ATP-binding protein
MAELMLEAAGLRKSYGRGESAVTVLNRLDLKVAAGEFLVILGPSGCGKSTLLNVLGLMDKPDAGEVSFRGRPTSTLGEEARALLRNDSLGFIFQFDSLLPEFTILENVTLPARMALSRGQSRETLAQTQERALALLRGLGLEGLRGRFPAQTSGGERQRAALCRALINRPAVLLADEPTGNLDKHNGERVFQDLKALAEQHGTAVIMVTHNESAGRLATRTVRMSDGLIE